MDEQIIIYPPPAELAAVLVRALIEKPKRVYVFTRRVGASSVNPIPIHSIQSLATFEGASRIPDYLEFKAMIQKDTPCRIRITIKPLPSENLSLLQTG